MCRLYMGNELAAAQLESIASPSYMEFSQCVAFNIEYEFFPTKCLIERILMC